MILFCIPLDALPDLGQGIAAVRCEMLRDAERHQKIRLVTGNFSRRVPAVKVAKQTRDGLDNERIRIADKKALRTQTWAGFVLRAMKAMKD